MLANSYLIRSVFLFSVGLIAVSVRLNEMNCCILSNPEFLRLIYNLLFCVSI
jgi:hypothetical protein